MAKTNEDQDALGNGRVVKQTKQVVKAKVVRDDWDDDDDDDENEEEQERAKASDCTAPATGGSTRSRDEQEEEEESSTIWEEANKRAPMPELIVARASTSQSCPPPPPAALQPTLRILKRPSPNSSGAGSLTSSGLTSASQGQRGTLAEREAQYQEARSRIFGDKDKVAITRDPLGPAELEPELGVPARPARGFGERRRGRK